MVAYLISYQRFCPEVMSMKWYVFPVLSSLSPTALLASSYLFNLLWISWQTSFSNFSHCLDIWVVPCFQLPRLWTLSLPQNLFCWIVLSEPLAVSLLGEQGCEEVLGRVERGETISEYFVFLKIHFK